ncbi:hypothetical protein [Streptomyces sp. VMFN-G11Ma]|uniref:RraA family protein n=1 Tax=Streptomyces sp. VMFN-G11Ma TaxID=2135609 RepID=UPI0021590387|nr:hypothetical protein [Streptomyces sp. VMFN-G11Ma]
MSSPDPLRPLSDPRPPSPTCPFRDDLAGTVRDFKHYFYGALGQEPAAGQVLVLSSGGHPEVSHGGGTKLARADGAGLAGVLADGRLRDFDQLRGHSFATWCTGRSCPLGRRHDHALRVRSGRRDLRRLREPRRLRPHGQRRRRRDPFSDPASRLRHRRGHRGRGGRGSRSHQGRERAAR